VSKSDSENFLDQGLEEFEEAERGPLSHRIAEKLTQKVTSLRRSVHPTARFSLEKFQEAFQ